MYFRVNLKFNQIINKIIFRESVISDLNRSPCHRRIKIDCFGALIRNVEVLYPCHFVMRIDVTTFGGPCDLCRPLAIFLI